MKRFLLILIIFSLWGGFFNLTAWELEKADARDLYAQAEKRLENGDYTLAMELYQRLTREYPLSSLISDAQFRIGQCFYHMGDNRKALEQMGRVAQRYRTTRYARYISFWRGLLSYRLDMLEEADKWLGIYIQEASTAQDVEGNFLDVYRKDAFLYRILSLKELGKREEAVKLLEELYRILKSPSVDPYVLTLLGNFYHEDGRLQDLEKLLDPVDINSLSSPWFEHLSFLKAEVLYSTGYEEEALSIYLRLTGSASQAAGPAYERVFTSYLEKGYLELVQGLISRAEVDLKDEAVLLNGFRLRAGIGFYRNGMPDRAMFFFDKVWEGRSEQKISYLVPLYMARIAGERNNYQAALSYLDTYSELYEEGRERVLYTKGEFLTRLEDWEEALELWKKYFNDYSDSEFLSPGSYHAGYSAYKLGRYSEALEFFEKVDPSILDGYQRQGLLRLKARLLGWTGKYDEAVTAWENYLAMYPEDWTSRGEALKSRFLSGDYSGTVGGAMLLKRRNDSIEDRALSALAYYLSGLSYLSGNRHKEALEDFMPLTRKQLESAGIGEVFPFVLYYRGWAFYQSADYVPALRDFRELSEILQDLGMEAVPSAELLSRATYLAGWCAYQLGDYEDAADFFYTYSTLEEHSGQGSLMYARSLSEAGDNEKAARVLEAAYKEAETTSYGDNILFELAGQLFKAGRIEDSMNRYLELYQEYPESSLAEEALFQRGENYMSLGQWVKAQDAYYLCRKAYPGGTLIAAAHYWGGLAAESAGEDFGAVLLWEKLLREYPDSPFRPLAFRKIGEVYMNRGDYSKALDYYRRLTDEYPEEARTLEVVTAVDTLRYLSSGEPKETAALRAQIKAYGGLENPESREAMLELARILLYRGGDYIQEAKLLLDDLVFYREEDLERASRAQYYLGEYYFRLGLFRKAEDEFLVAAAMNPDDRDLMAMSIFRAAESALEQGRKNTADQLVKRLEENFPDSEWYREGREMMENAR